MSKSRSYLLTIPFKYENKIISLKKIIDSYSPFQFLVLQLESGVSTGYKHYQAYIEFENPRSFESIRKILPFVHIEKRLGTQKEAYDYCTKDDTRLHGPFEFGTKPYFNSKSKSDGKKAEFIKAVLNGSSNLDLLLNFPTIYSERFINEIKKAANIRDKFELENRDIEVSYIFGPAGSGKSTFIRSLHEVDDIYVVSDYEKYPFDNYNGQSVLIFEEYRSNLPLSMMLQYLDRYPLMLPARYGNKIAKFTKVYFTSNWRFEQQYQSAFYDDLNAFKRRFKYIYEVDFEYIRRFEYDKKHNLIKNEFVYNPLGEKSKQFPGLPTSFDNLYGGD